MFRNAAAYEARVAYGVTALLPALILPLYALVAALSWLSRNETPTAPEILQVFVLLLPLTAALSATHLMGIERENDFDPLRRTYPETSWRLPLIRTAGALTLTALSAGVSLLLLRLGGGGFQLDLIVLPAVPGTLFLVMLALLANNVTGNLPAAVVAVAGYWFMEAQTRGDVTGALFLFSPVAPLTDVDPALTQWLLLAAAAALCLANVAWSVRRRRAGG